MTGPDPAEYGWWLASRAAGVVALLCITVSVGVGLAMAGRVSRRPALARTLLNVHQQTALTGLVAIAVHGITLLGDRFLSPSIGDLVIPFTSKHEPLWTGLGVTGGWLAAILGLSYWIRHRIRAGLWRKLHRATILVYILAVAHTLGAGTDAAEPWMRVLLLTTGAPILFLFLMRLQTPATGPAFRRFRVADVRPESNTVLSFDLVPADRKPPQAYRAGQFVTLRVNLPGGEQQLRSYSLSSGPRPASYRISVKREPGGRVSEHLHAAIKAGDRLELSGPTGRFVIGESTQHALALISAGIGVTPVLAMLESVADERSERPVWWIHSARNGAEHAFRSEAQAHVLRLRDGHSHVRYTQPQPRDHRGRDYDAAGRLTGSEILGLGVPIDAEFRLCGPTSFVSAVTADLLANGAQQERIHSESFGGAPAPRPAGPATLIPAAEGPAVEFSRSGVTTAWGSDFNSLLEVAEANAVPVASGCRIGDCHGCRAAVLTGSVRHDPEPVEPPPGGSALLCCAVPETDVVLDA
jgi:ferredoxin-NADP reductase